MISLGSTHGVVATGADRSGWNPLPQCSGLHAIQREPEAKRQVLQALEESPRYAEALELLLDIYKRRDDERYSASEAIESTADSPKESG